MAERDPRIAPAVGDVLRKGAATRTVVKSPPMRNVQGAVGYTNQRGTACSCWITTWRIWSKGLGPSRRNWLVTGKDTFGRRELQADESAIGGRRICSRH